MRKSRKMALLMLPILAAYIFQATQYARAPVKYNFYIVYAKNADIALRPGSDLSPNGETLLQNATTQEGLYNLTLGQWGPGYRVNYTDAFNVTNREAFAIKMIGFNFSGTGGNYLNLYALNDTDLDGFGETEVLVWDGADSALNSTNYIWFNATAAYGTDGGTSRLKVMINIPETGVTIDTYSGTIYFWFTSATF
jgi:hypothetical protein